MSSALQGCGGARRAVLAENSHPSRCQPIRPLCNIGVAVATGDSSLIRGTPCRQAVWQADVPARGWLWSTVVHPGSFVPLIKPFQCFSMTEKRDRLEHLKRSLFYIAPNYGKWRHMPPRDLERTPCRHPCRTENLRKGVYHNRRKSQNGCASVFATLTRFFSHLASENRAQAPLLA
jgi:hypothetical protein